MKQQGPVPSGPMPCDPTLEVAVPLIKARVRRKSLEEMRRTDRKRPLGTNGPYKIADDVIASGEIPRRWGPTHNKAVYGPDPASEDLVADDVALYLATDDGLVALTGCDHAGVENIVEYGLELTER